jgi:hypothetical protein
MAKRHKEPTSSNTSTIVLAVGGILVAALVVWALTRQVEPPPAPASATFTPMIAPPGRTTATDTTFTTSTSGTQAQTESTLPMPTTGTAAPADDPEGAVPRISAQDLKQRIDAGTVLLVDVRDASSYQAGHIPGAIHMPLSSVEGMMTALPKGKEIVTYCT